MRFILIPSFIFSLFLLNPNVHAQVVPASPKYDKGWFVMAVGAGYPLDLSGSLSANFGRDRFWQIALQNTGNFSLGGKATNATSISGSYGVSSVDRIGRAAISAGPGLAFGLTDPDDVTRKRDRFFAPALVANAQVFITPFKEMGVGLDVFGNLNPRLSTLGIRLSLVIEGHK